MDLKLAGKTALITGASKGIGGAAAAQLASEGCHLVLVARTAGDLARAKESIARKANVSVETVPADLSDSANVTRLARQFPDIDILVNNAGRHSWRQAARHRRGDVARGLGSRSQGGSDTS